MVESGAGHGKVMSTLSMLAGVIIKMVGFERDDKQYEVAQRVLEYAQGLGHAKKVLSPVVILIVEMNEHRL